MGLDLNSFIRLIKQREIPDTWKDITQIKKEEVYLDSLVQKSSPPSIYGVTTLVGHLDKNKLNQDNIQDFQSHLIKNHKISLSRNYYSLFQATCILYVKLHHLNLGGTGVTSTLYSHLLRIGEDESFQPKIPKESSYSSGDVIPAAHWASEVISYLGTKEKYQLKRKEGLTLINGSFVHVGLSIASYDRLVKLRNILLFNAIVFSHLYRPSQSVFYEGIPIKKNSRFHSIQSLFNKYIVGHNKSVQDPVSVRAIPQVLDAFCSSMDHHKNTLGQVLNHRSDNPLIDEEYPFGLSQASFLEPKLTLSTSQMIDTLLMAGWNIERRVHHLLSGNHKKIPANGTNKENELGMIQLPKYITSLLEDSRKYGGVRSFANGSSTSYGIEDFWSYGLQTDEILNTVLDNIEKILKIEIVIYMYCYNKFTRSEKFETLESYMAQFEPSILELEFEDYYSEVTKEDLLSFVPSLIDFENE
ncbi:aromatic amino acid lyase [Alkalihalobacterium sp. APHAB7]|uniref:aromatic amino acid lyase n=1 Tax=Alkalihalobacterium sp. APHAB7 TaxID=3402081 RepID=UPI003AAA55B0